KRESEEMNSSDMPSEKYSLAASPVEFINGRTAIDFSLIADLDSLGTRAVLLSAERAAAKRQSNPPPKARTRPMMISSVPETRAAPRSPQIPRPPPSDNQTVGQRCRSLAAKRTPQPRRLSPIAPACVA